MSSQAGTVAPNCRYSTELSIVTNGMVCVNVVLIFCVGAIFSYKSLKFIQMQKEINNPVCKTTRYFITFCIFGIIMAICSHITLIWAIIICITQNEKLLNTSWTVHGTTILMSGYCGASIFVIRLQIVFENTMFAIKKSILNLL